MQVRRLILASSLAVTTAIAFFALSELDAAAAPGAPPTGMALLPPPPIDPQSLVQRLGENTFGNIYGGMVASNGNDDLTIYLTELDPTVEAAFSALSPELNLTFKKTINSLASLDSMMRSLDKDWDAIQAEGTDLITFGPNEATGKLNIGVENLVPADTEKFDEMFGAENVYVYNETPDDVSSVRYQNRVDDTAPYYGGDAMVDSGLIETCTSGWGITIVGIPRFLTAGHCWNPGYSSSVPTVSIINLKSGPVGSGHPMGVETQNGFNINDQLDAAVVSGCDGTGRCGGTGYIWTGAPGSPTLMPVAGGGTWADGDVVCASGAYSGEPCDLLITLDDQCFQIQGYKTCHLNFTTATNGNTTVGGDSGCPVYKKMGGYVYALGTNVAGSSTLGTEYFAGIYAELNKFGAKLITS